MTPRHRRPAAAALRESGPPRASGPRTVAVRDEMQIPIACSQDIIVARQRGRALAQELGFSSSDLTLIATIISELTRNILNYAGRGTLVLGVLERDRRRGIAVVARDHGPGIPDVARALEIGYSTSGSLGLGLPGVRRLMDEFEIDSCAGRGTTVTARKWIP